MVFLYLRIFIEHFFLEVDTGETNESKKKQHIYIDLMDLSPNLISDTRRW